MDWDGIGTFALFLSGGAVSLAIVAFRAYKTKLAAKLEFERLRRSSTPVDEVVEQVQALETEVRRLKERVEFSERLLSKTSEKGAEV